MGTFDFNGAGDASFIGKSTEWGQFVYYAESGCSGDWAGTVVMTSSKRAEDYLAMELYSGQPCKKKFTYAVVGGFGKFKGATGSGTVLFTCKRNYTDQWSGTLSY